MFFYSDTEKSSFKGSFNASNYNPNDMICKHLENYFFLKFILLKSEDRIEKHQASKELDICERKMNFWKKQSSFHLTHPEVTARRIKAGVLVESRLMIPFNG